MQPSNEHRFISTAIPYVNASPHLGFALELLLADVIARQARLDDEPVFFLTGSDDNSLKNALAAAEAGVATQAFVDQHSAEFAALGPLLNISNDDFLATSQDARHSPAVTALWQACAAAGDIYQADYQGLYCVGCEAFYATTELNAQGLCPEHLTAPEPVAETNYFFRLSRYQSFLQAQIEQDNLKIRPASRRNEVLSFLRQPLQDLSISRSRQRARGWGIAVPGDNSQVVYVWFDALANYISALGYASETNAAGDSAAARPSTDQLQHFWHNAQHVQHLIGKGVLRFHAVYWPAILASAGLRIPTDLLVHGYITLEGTKISKSLGNTLSPATAVDYFGLDALRYFLLRHIGGQGDGDFSLARLTQTYNSELANQLGNLLSRTCALGIKHLPIETLNTEHLSAERLPSAVRASGPKTQGLRPQPGIIAADVPNQVRQLIYENAPQRALALIWQQVEAANAYISAEEPWRLAKADPIAGNKAKLHQVLIELYAALATIGQLLAPLLPKTSKRIKEALSATKQPLPPLFPRRR